MLAGIVTLWVDYVWPIFLLVFGFGLVIFVHELGHFLACKAVGVRVDRFALGFGPRLLGFKRGDTDYCIKLLPLGGYIKMLGQEDFEAMEEGGEATGDPRSFLNKPIWARMVIVSAGVVVNVIFAAVLFVVVCISGIEFLAPVVGGTVRGFPADTIATSLDAPAPDDKTGGGLRPGDVILTIGDTEIASFDKIGLIAALADEDEKFLVTFKRDGKIGTCVLGVKMGPRGRLIFGIEPPHDLVLSEPTDKNIKTPFKAEDRILAINRRPIENYWDIRPIEDKLDGSAVTVRVLRDGKETDERVRPVPYLGPVRVVFNKKDGKAVRYTKSVKSKDKKEIELTLPDGTSRTFEIDKIVKGRANLLDVFGLIPRLRVVTVLEGSRADKAGIRPGDIITRYADTLTPTFTELREINERFVDKGTDMKVERDSKGLDAMWIVPKERKGRYEIGIRIGVDGAHTVVADVRLGSLAEAAKLRPGDVITEINGAAVKTWDDIVAERRKIDSGPVTIKYMRGANPGEAVIEDAAKAVFGPKDYRFSIFTELAVFKLLMGPETRKTNPLAAISWGAGQTWDMIVLNYATIRSMARGTVDASEVRGPVGIVGLGIEVGRRGIVKLTYFLAMISVCLAVFNFLPLPLVDGGLAVILIIEKIRRKPLSLRVMNIVQMSGLVLILSLFVWVTWNDIARIVGDLW